MIEGLRTGALQPVGPSDESRDVTEVVGSGDLPPGSSVGRRAVVRWSDGTEGEALRW
jgi:hypothetical protein